MTLAIDQWIDGSLTWSELLQILHTQNSGSILTKMYQKNNLTFGQLLKGLSYERD